MVAKLSQILLACAVPLALTACGGGDAAANLNALDGELVDADNAVDPALASALEDQIMVDPTLAAQANADAIRPPARPPSAPIPAENIAGAAAPKASSTDGETMRAPPVTATGRACTQCAAARESMTLGALAARQRDRGTRGCVANISYSARWAERLPRDLPLHPQARVREAAGTESAACHLRVVSFVTPVAMQGMIDWYYTRARRAGYSAEHGADGEQHVLGGTRGRDDGAYLVTFTARGDGGTDIDLVVNNGV